MSPEFDPAKNSANITKHGVSLSEGDGVLYDPLALTVENTAALDEQRWQTLDMNVFGKLMVVVWTQRERDIRLISVRKAGPKERRDYEKGG